MGFVRFAFAKLRKLFQSCKKNLIFFFVAYFLTSFARCKGMNLFLIVQIFLEKFSLLPISPYFSLSEARYYRFCWLDRIP